MKPEANLALNTQDRIATLDEIRIASSVTAESLLELCQVPGSYCEVSSDMGGVVRYPAEEFEFFSYLSEMEDSAVN